MLQAGSIANNASLLQWQVATRRSQAAYRELFMQFAIPATRFAATITRSEETAEEVYCDVMKKLWDMGEDLAKVDNYRLYLFRAVKNTALNYLRKQHKTIVSLDQVPAGSYTAADAADTITLRHELLQHAEAIVSRFSPQCQAVYRLVKEDGFTYKEAAAVLDISINTVEFHMKGALAKLRAGLSVYLTAGKKS